VITDLKPYPAYKDSGIEWLGRVPKTWSVLPLAVGFRSALQRNTGMQERTVLSLSYGQIVIKPEDKLHGLAPESFETYQRVFPGDIIIRTTDLQNDQTSLRVGAVKTQGIITSAYLRLIAKGVLVPTFDYLLLHAYDLMKVMYGYGSGLRQSLDFADLKRIPMAIPSAPEQMAIARFLEYVGLRIQRLIKAKEALIGLVDEERQAIIHQAVTGELNREVSRKASGLDWLGDVPGSWDIIPLRLRYSVRLGKMLDTKRITGASLIPYLRNTDVQWDRINTDDLPEMDISPEERPRYTVDFGDLLVCEGGEVGRAAIWDRPQRVGYQKALHRLRPYDSERDKPRFLYYVLRAMAGLGLFKADGSESTIAHLTAEKLRRLRVPFPPAHEQEAMAMELDGELRKREGAVATARSQINLLREYRVRLISDVVTGKLDVREAAANLPEDPDADEPALEERLEEVAAG
jgi:type I restriction enzyme, S subunit